MNPSHRSNATNIPTPPMTTSMNLSKLTFKARKRLPLLAIPAAVALSPGRADAILTYNIFQSGADVVIQGSGEIILPETSGGPSTCSPLINASDKGFCIGPASDVQLYSLKSQQPIGFTATIASTSSDSSGLASGLISASTSFFAIDSNYVSGRPYSGSTTFRNQTLAGLGLTTTPGLIGTWTFNDLGYTANDQIQVFIGPPSASVPGPLPLLGASAAFAWSRKLRRRVGSSSSS